MAARTAVAPAAERPSRASRGPASSPAMARTAVSTITARSQGCHCGVRSSRIHAQAAVPATVNGHQRPCAGLGSPAPQLCRERSATSAAIAGASATV